MTRANEWCCWQVLRGGQSQVKTHIAPGTERTQTRMQAPVAGMRRRTAALPAIGLFLLLLDTPVCDLHVFPNWCYH